MLSIVVKTQFEAVHSWPDCPHEDVSFLRNPHHHTFHVHVRLRVHSTLRDVEFIRFKRQIDAHLNALPMDLGSMSCERLCHEIYSLLARDGYQESCWFVGVYEEGEHGAELDFSRSIA